MLRDEGSRTTAAPLQGLPSAGAGGAAAIRPIAAAYALLRLTGLRARHKGRG
jgi:hypothetical protein